MWLGAHTKGGKDWRVTTEILCGFREAMVAIIGAIQTVVSKKEINWASVIKDPKDLAISIISEVYYLVSSISLNITSSPYDHTRK